VRNFELVLTEPINHISFYINPGVTAKTFKDRKPIRTKPGLVLEGGGLLSG
jgi:hypothetical protein